MCRELLDSDCALVFFFFHSFVTLRFQAIELGPPLQGFDFAAWHVTVVNDLYSCHPLALQAAAST